ncbi:MAG: helix-hairpin-helix domain-containing protein [Acidobacteria bacterium]|nr:helix-hairpin-helix domain-containing protein [Acidobacteriota bacterium]
MNRIHRSIILCALILTLTTVTLASAADGMVNINSAGLDELMLLPRVGETVAQRIVDFRQENGDFKSTEDLLLVKGIGDKTFEHMAPHVSVSGETTLDEKVRSPRPATADEE